MATVRIMLAPREVLRDAYFEKDIAKLVAEHMHGYIMYPCIETEAIGTAAAEEMFDLTNNPSRQEEREEKYGRFRSVSVGDIVEVDGVKYLCASADWMKLE